MGTVQVFNQEQLSPHDVKLQQAVQPELGVLFSAYARTVEKQLQATRSTLEAIQLEQQAREISVVSESPQVLHTPVPQRLSQQPVAAEPSESQPETQQEVSFWQSALRILFAKQDSPDTFYSIYKARQEAKSNSSETLQKAA